MKNIIILLIPIIIIGVILNDYIYKRRLRGKVVRYSFTRYQDRRNFVSFFIIEIMLIIFLIYEICKL